MLNISLVLINNGDTEPEAYAFRHLEDAEVFVSARGMGEITDLPVISSPSELRDLIAEVTA
jgi:hypothetical protein